MVSTSIVSIVLTRLLEDEPVADSVWTFLRFFDENLFDPSIKMSVFQARYRIVEALMVSP